VLLWIADPSWLTAEHALQVPLRDDEPGAQPLITALTRPSPAISATGSAPGATGTWTTDPVSTTSPAQRLAACRERVGHRDDRRHRVRKRLVGGMAAAADEQPALPGCAPASRRSSWWSFAAA
jgi:hypothetical protein